MNTPNVTYACTYTHMYGHNKGNMAWGGGGDNKAMQHIQCILCLSKINTHMCNELGVMGSGVNLTQNMNRHDPMNV